MDKQKQIEEMAKHGCYDGCASGLRKFCEEYDGKPCKNMVRIASGLYEQGYRKIPESAVVLTREEYKNMQFVTEFIGTKQKIGACDFNRVFLQHERKICKETAEKFAERLKEKLNEWLEDNEDLNGKINFGIAQIELIGVESLDGEIISESLIDEICKEITEGKGNENG